MRLLDCFAFVTAELSCGLLAAGVVFLFFFVGARLRSWSGRRCGGSGEARRKTEGEGIVIVSAMGRDSCHERETRKIAELGYVSRGPFAPH